MRSRAVLGSIASFLFVAGVLAAGTSSAQQARVAGTRPDCVAPSSAARFDGSGYSHWVSVQNRCDYDVQCTITTNANPSPTALRVGAGRSESVNTFLASPAREFTPNVDCTRVGR